MRLIKLSEPYVSGLEEKYLLEALGSPVWHGDGEFTARATDWLRELTGSPGMLLTTSCTHALEMANLLLGVGPGDEVICPSYTFPSAAAAVAVRGATPVFVDVTPDTLNLDPVHMEAAITSRTRAVCLVHYGGVAADLDAITKILAARAIPLIEDNAHGLGATWRGRQLGTFGDFATYSFHDTKNVTSGEGGALQINDPRHVQRAEILREKGTNRSQFLRGQVDKYTWTDLGSSYLPSDLLSALLLAQLDRFEEIQKLRHLVWTAYDEGLRDWAAESGVRQMLVPDGAEHAAHLYYLVMPSPADQDGLIEHLRQRDIVSAFHYQPLDSSPAGLRLGRTPEPCPVTAEMASRLVRLPLHPKLTAHDVSRVLDGVLSYRLRT
jgi:dTDP-4-amino-4,6-dideoxygalactose transaminase